MNISYYTTVQSTWDALHKDCLSAQTSIRFEQFILRDFDPGSVGDTFAQLFIKKAQEGVSVRLLLDVVGSYHLFRSPPLLKKMRKAGIKIRFISFQFQRLRDMLDWTPRRNHRKLAIIDGEVAYIGGVVFSDDAKSWNDFHVRIEGVGDMFTQAFDAVWTNKRMKKLFKLTARSKTLPVTLIGNEHANNVLYQVLCRRIKNAKKQITIITPYFSPGSVLRNLLIKAGKRGVAVRIIIPARTDHFAAQIAHLSFGSFSKHKNISLVAVEKMNHAKIIQIDDWLTFGSSNFDRLSLFYNKELNIQTIDKTIVDAVARVAIEPFSKDAEPFTAVSRRYYRSPIIRGGLSLVGYFLRPFI